jgi:hypothetical protein
MMRALAADDLYAWTLHRHQQPCHNALPGRDLSFRRGALWCTVHCLSYFVVHGTLLKVHCGALYTA